MSARLARPSALVGLDFGMDEPQPAVVDRSRTRNHVRWLDAAAIALCLSGLVHLGIWLAADGQGGAWAGPLSWRKPILFGISGGLTTWSLARVMNRIVPRPEDAAISIATSVSIVLEVALITLQTWRGVPSHFNRDTTLDATIELAMLILITEVVVAIVAVTVRAIRHFDAPASTTLAYRTGLLFLVVSCGLGYLTTIVGSIEQLAGRDPATYGAAGVPKFPHGVTIHAIQIFPAVAFIIRRLASERLALRIVRWAVALTAGLLTYAVIQTSLGLGRVPPSPPALAAGLAATFGIGATLQRQSTES